MSLLLTIIAIIVADALMVVGICIAYYIIMSPSSVQVDGLKEWLQYAVTLAEREFGPGTGQLKLRFVYQLFVEKFPNLAKYISFSTISEYVNEALEWLNKQLSSNKAVSTYVGTTTSTTSTTTETTTVESTTEEKSSETEATMNPKTDDKRVDLADLTFTNETEEIDDVDATDDAVTIMDADNEKPIEL